MQAIIERLNKAKKQRGYTLKDLAEKSGITLGTVNKIMSGELQRIKPDKLEKLAAALNVTVDYLVNGETTPDKAHADNYLGLVKIACISPDVRVADVEYNVTEIIGQAKRAAANGVKIALFPELCVTAYSCGDLFFQETLRRAALDGLKTIRDELKTQDLVCIVGLPICDDSGRLYNAAAVVFRGEVLGVVPKVNLPNYNEFMEKRLFAPFDGVSRTITLFGKQTPFASKLVFCDTACADLKFAVEICEDVWVADSPSVAHSKAGANAVFNLSASNETVTKSDYRKKMIEIQSAECGVVYAYCSAGPSESTSQTVFSAHNIISENGEVIAEAAPFTTGYAEAYADVGYIANERVRLDRSQNTDGYNYVGFDLKIEGGKRVYDPHPFVPQDVNRRDVICERALTILAYGLKKRIEHTRANKLVIGISGGSDSTLALLICKRALALLNRPMTDIIAVTMPCFGTSERTLNNSVALARSIGATVKKIDVSAAVTRHLQDINHDLTDANVTYENAQARERTQVLMDIANDVNGLVIGTGDASEAALGWATYNGDHMSMYAVNAAVPKTLVLAIIAYQAKLSQGELKRVLQDVLDTPISPELLPPTSDGHIAQQSESAIGPYELHDYFLFMLIRKGFTPAKVYAMAKLSFADKYDGETIYKWLTVFIRRFFSQQFKRSCSPDGVKLGSVDLSKYGLRMPSDACANAWLENLKKVKPQ